MAVRKNNLKYLLLSLLLIIISPSVFAYGIRTGISPLNKGLEVIGNIFNIEILRTNEMVQIGFLKFMLFVVLFAVSNMALKKIGGKNGHMFDNKTAGIVSFAFSMIGVFMMPIAWLQATGGLITVIMSSIIFLGFFIGLAVVAVFVLRKKGDDDKMGWIKNLVGLILLFILLTLLDDFAAMVNLPVLLLIRPEWIINSKNKK